MEALSGDMGLVFDAGFRMDMNTAPLNVASQSAVTPNAPLMGAAPVATAAAVSSGSSTGAIGEWKAWDDAAFDSMNFELDLGFDTFLMATADDFMQPHTAPQTAAAQTAMTATSPTSPPVFSDAVDSSSSCPSESECSVTDEDLAMMLSVVKAESAPVAKRSRKRKNPETLAQKKQQTAKATASKTVQKKAKSTQQKSNAHTTISADAERLFRRRYDILHEILEAWNTGGIEDMEEIADDVYDTDVTLVSPDYSEGLKGVQALMHHWTLLLDSFPDGIMEEYQITRDDPEGQKMNVSWVFSGTHIFPFFGVEPRHKKITLRGKSFFTFKGEKINQMVLSWNYRDALMQLMG